MRSLAKYAVIGMAIIGGSLVAAQAQLGPPCAAFYRDANGEWNAAAPVTVDTRIGLVDIMPGHPVGAGVANILDARCR